MIGAATRRLLLAAAALGLALSCLWVLRPFIVPILWAAILAYASWPLYRALRRPLRRLGTLAALLMTLLIGCAVVLPVLWILVLVQGELIVAYHQLAGYLAHGPPMLPPLVRRTPWLGEHLQEALRRYSADPAALAQQASGWVLSWASRLGTLIGGVGRNLLRVALTFVTLFFLFRDGERVAAQGQRVLQGVFHDRLAPYLLTAGRMTRAVVYGLLVTAFVQGLIAGIGYAVIGLSAPVLLGLLTGVLSFVPLAGTAILWVPISLWLLVSGHVIKGIVLLGWGSLLVHPAENVLRPLLISNAMRVPFLLVLFGALGGLAAFGLIGIFLGPVLLAVGLSVWREWAERV